MRDMLYGITPVHQALLHRRRELHHLHVREGAASERLQAILKCARDAGVEVHPTDNHDLARRAGHRHHQGVVLDCGPLPTHDLRGAVDAGLTRRVLALDQVEDPQNVGGLARTAAFLGASTLLIHRAHSAPLSPAASKASAGNLEAFPVTLVPNLAQALSELRDQGATILGAALGEDSVPYREAAWPEPWVLVVGNEGDGLRSLTRRRCDQLVRIDGVAGVESLNVTVAAGIVLAHACAASRG